MTQTKRMATNMEQCIMADSGHVTTVKFTKEAITITAAMYEGVKITLTYNQAIHTPAFCVTQAIETFNKIVGKK